MITHDDPFPVQWDDPGDAQAFWVFDETHSGHQMSPLDFELRQSPLLEAGNRVNDSFGLPFKSQPKLIHGFVYLKGIIADLPPDEVAGALKEADAAVRRVGSELGSRWEAAWLPEIQRHSGTSRSSTPLICAARTCPRSSRTSWASRTG
jgi:hypothetical protein